MTAPIINEDSSQSENQPKQAKVHNSSSSSPDSNDIEELDANPEDKIDDQIEETGTVHRKLKTRHLSMIALGGSIGTGLFMASGKVISTSGPGGALAAYIIVGIMVFFLMEGLGEMATYMPVSGSYMVFSAKFVDSSLGFAIGWNEWFKESITYAVDIKTASVLMQFWFPNVYGWIFSLIAWAIIFTINALSVKSFGEVEYWLSIIKVVTIMIFLVVGVLRIFGVGGEALYFDNFTVGEAPFVGGVLALVNVLIVAGFSFQGTEMIGVTAGESKSPEKNVPAAIKQVFWRILIFYVLSILVISLILPYTDPNLLRSDPKDISVSPFTLVFKSIGIPGAKDIMNVVILTAILSAANSATYSSSRMLFSLANLEKAPQIFGRVNSRGIPFFALLSTTCISGVIFLLSFLSEGAYGWLIDASGLAGLMNWLVISLSHFRFRRAFLTQGHELAELAYHSRFFPFGPLFSITFCILIILGQAIDPIRKQNWESLVVTYMTFPFFIALLIGYKIRYKTKVVPLEEVELYEKPELTDLQAPISEINEIE